LALELPGDRIDWVDAVFGALLAAVGMLTGWDPWTPADGKGDFAPSLLPLADLDPPTELPLLDAEAAVFGTGGMSLRSEIIFCRLFNALLIFAWSLPPAASRAASRASRECEMDARIDLIGG
jgi:hypothetical protein